MPKRRTNVVRKHLPAFIVAMVLLGFALILSIQFGDYSKTQVLTPTVTSGSNTYVCTCACTRYVPGDGDIALCVVPYEDTVFGRACPDGGAEFQRTVTATDAKSAEAACYQLTQNAATNGCAGYLPDTDSPVAGTLIGCAVTDGPSASPTMATTPTVTPTSTNRGFFRY